MSDKSAIEWTDATWNPVTGCDRVSPGCDHCYALNLAPRLKAMGNPSYQTDGTRKTSGPGFGVALHPEMLDKPLRWKRPRRVFVNSMSDLFHSEVPDSFIFAVFDVMKAAEQHTFQVLTKRPRRMAHIVPRWLEDHGLEPSPNVWLGVSVENQEWADKRIPLLLETPAAVRFLSCEPLIGPVDLRGGLGFSYDVDDVYTSSVVKVDVPAVNWVIVGGESGPGARPMHPTWARSLRDQCVAAGVPFFFKQWGAWTPSSIPLSVNGRKVSSFPDAPHAAVDSYAGYNSAMARVGKKRAGRDLDGRTWDEMPAMEQVS